MIESLAFRDRRKVKQKFQYFIAVSFLFILTALLIIFQGFRDNKRLLKQLENESTHDELTGLPNRRFLFEWLHTAISRDRKQEFPFTALFLDLNHFKAVNDHLGHGTGDLVLKKAVKRFQSVLREEDMLVRLGGDEFIAIIREKLAPIDQEVLVKRLKKTLEYPSLVPEDFPVHFGLSIGIASYPEDGETIEELLHSADKRMYQDKLVCKQQTS